MTSFPFPFLSLSPLSAFLSQLFSQACPVPLQFDYYFWNVTNPDAVRLKLFFHAFFHSLGFSHVALVFFCFDAQSGLKRVKLVINLISLILFFLIFFHHTQQIKLSGCRASAPCSKRSGPALSR